MADDKKTTTYERKREAADKLARDIVKHSDGNVSPDKARQIAGDTARRQDQRDREKR